MDVQNLVLPAAEDAESIWTKKLGFRKMSEERVSEFCDSGLMQIKNIYLPYVFLDKLVIGHLNVRQL